MKFVRIKDIMSVNRGASPRPISNTAYFSDTGTYGWVRISDVTKSDKHLFNTEEKLSDLGSSFSVKLDKPTLFLSIAGSVGKACINKIPVCIHDGFVYFSSIKNYDINYLFWFFSNSIIYEGLGKKGVFLNLNIDTIKNILIPKLKIDEQLKISKFLDSKCLKIDQEVSLLQKKSILLDEYKSALIYETVTKGLDKNIEMKNSGNNWIGEAVASWPIKRLKDVYVYKNGYAFSDEDYCDDSESYLVKITNIGSEHNFKNMQNLKINKLTEKFRIKNNSILYALSGSVGKCSFYNAIENKGCYLNQRVAELTIKNGNIKYFYYVMSNNSFKNEILCMIQGNVIKNLNKGHLDNSFTPVPNIETQNEIVKYLDNETQKIEKQIELINKKVELLKEYKQSLIYEAVTGQLEIE